MTGENDISASDEREHQFAIDLIREVRKNLAPEADLLQRRINAALAYLADVATPNRITLDHVRRYLEGSYDRMLPPV